MKPYVPCAISVRAKTSPLSTYAAVIVLRSWRSTTSRGRIAAAATRRYATGRLESNRMAMAAEKRYAVVSCHVERPLDDCVWTRFEALAAARPGGGVPTPPLLGGGGGSGGGAAPGAGPGLATGDPPPPSSRPPSLGDGAP